MNATRTVAEKMGVRTGSRALLIGAPAEAVEAMRLPELAKGEGMSGAYDYIHLFVRSQDEMARLFPEAKAHLGEGGMLWVSWPKGRRDGTDLTQHEVIRIGYDFGLVESTGLSIDATWSGLKFTWPKPGKVYHNSYGTLPA